VNVLKLLLAPARDLIAFARMAKIDEAHGLKSDALLRLVLIAKDAITLRQLLLSPSREKEVITIFELNS